MAHTTTSGGGTVAAGVDATQRLMGVLHSGARDATILVVSDSTATGATSWLPAVVDHIAANHPAWTVTTRAWSDTTSTYAAPVTVQTGAGGTVRTLTVYNASAAGFTTAHWNGARAVAAFRGLTPDLTIVSLGHNEQGVAALWHPRMVTLTETLTTMHPGADLLLISQNPATTNTHQQERAHIYREIATRRGYGYINVTQAFTDTGNPAALTTDGVHPTTTGYQLWADTITPAFTHHPGRHTTQPPSPLTTPGDNLLANPDFQLVTAGVPDHWRLTNATAERDTTNYETYDFLRPTGGGAHTSRATKFTGNGTGPSAELGQFVPYRGLLGQHVTLTARMYIPVQTPTNPGRIGITAGTSTTNLAPPAGTPGAWQWIALTHYVPTTAVSLRAFMYIDLSSTPTGSVTLERMTLVVGKYPHGR